MKNSKLKAALFAASVLISFSSVKAQKGFQIGLEGTPQLSYLANQADIDSDLWKSKHAVNGSFGLSTQLGFTEQVGIGLNVLYSFQGDKYTWKGIERYKTLQYVKIPLMLTLNFPVGDMMLVTAKVGPQLSVLSDARLLDKDNNNIVKNYSKPFEDIDFGAMLSAGIGYKLTDAVCIDMAFRYDLGFLDAEDKRYIATNIHNPTDVVTPSPASSPRGGTRNMTLGMTFGIRYTIM